MQHPQNQWKKCVLAIDLGTSSVKVLIVAESGEVLARAAVGYPVSRPTPGWAEQDPEVWWSATVLAVKRAIASTPGTSIEAIGLSGQMHGSVFIDTNGSPLRPAIIWEDARSGAEADQLTSVVGKQALIETCGSPVASGFQAASIRWVQQHEPAIWARTATVLLPKDFIRYRLTGELLTDPGDASGTALFDIHRRDWSGTLLDAVGISRNQLPAIGHSTRPGGHLTNSAAKELSLSPGIPLSGGSGDAPLALLASGASTGGSMLVTLSSGSQVMLPTSSPLQDAGGRTHAWCSALEPERGAGWYAMVATLASGSALRWFLDEIIGQDSQDASMDLDMAVGDIPVGANGLLFLPYLAGERSPHMDPLASGAFFGLTFRHDRRHLIRAVLEGSILALRDASLVFEEAGIQPDQIVLTGGGSRSHVWSQIVADVFGLPVTVNGQVDGSAMGAALTAAAMLDWIDPANPGEGWIQTDIHLEPDPANHRRYQDDLSILQEIFASTQGQMHRLRERG